jgi:hypothetical protein
MSAEIIELDVITKLDLNASEILREIAKEDPKHVFLVVWPKDGGHPTFHASTSDTPVVLYQLERFKISSSLKIAMTRKEVRHECRHC